ncbi:hypothetical protein IPM09_02600 [Candidatus Saccharibacteria bacterium]|nr:MAG: hypothetical protein IPM09_02600 [Candidatus Saccharibacteria bacterium]
MARPGRQRQRGRSGRPLVSTWSSRPPRFTIAWAYGELETNHEKRHTPAFRWALEQARATDKGHEREYPASDYEFFIRDLLLQLAEENIRGWMGAYKTRTASPRVD